MIVGSDYMSKKQKFVVFRHATLNDVTLRKYCRTFVRISSHFKQNLQIDLKFSIKDLYIPNFCCTFAVGFFKNIHHMNIFDQVSEDIKKAMLAKDKVALDALRGIKKEFLEAKTAPGSDGELRDDKALQIMQKLVKQRKESAEMYRNANRLELAEEEMNQCAIIARYLPAMLSDEELTQALQAIIAQVGANGPQDMGKVMGVATKQLAGKAEGRAISTKVKELLAKE